MSLKLSNFKKHIVGGVEISMIEIRLGEQYVLPVSITNSDGSPVDLTNWTFTVTTDLYTATTSYSGDGSLASISSFTDQGSVGTSYSGLEITNVTPLAGTAYLTIPAGVNPNPSSLVTADGDNTMLNIITIKCQYPSAISGFNNVRKLLVGIVVRFG
jgi:hypothetical protein